MNNNLSLYTPPYKSVKNYYDMIDTAVSHNISSIEGFCLMDFEKPDTDAAKRIREYADSKDVTFSCFSVFINLVGEDRAEMLEKLKGYADVSAILGSPYLHHTIACEFANPANIIPYKEELFANGIKSVRAIYDYCDSIGIRAIYEEQGYLFNGVAGFARFLDSVDRNVGVVADFANIYHAGGNIEDFVDKFGDRVVHAHIKDITLTDIDVTGNGLATLDDKYMNEALIGNGIVDIKGTIDALRAKGYDGYYGIEYGFCDDDSNNLRDALAYVDRLLV